MKPDLRHRAEVPVRERELYRSASGIIAGRGRTWAEADRGVHSSISSLSPFQHFFVGAYAIPNVQIHATLASIGRNKTTREEADFAFKLALGLIIAVIGYQNVMYKLNMEDDIASLAKQIGAECMLPSS